MLLHRLVFLGFIIFGSTQVKPHEESGPWGCDPDPEKRVGAEFRPGIITLDGHADDWAEVDGFEFSLLPALDPDQENEFKGGKMTVKALHDGKDVYFLLQVGGDYAYSKGDNSKCPSVALMFQVGDSASYHNMGGCKESPQTCTSKSCRGYEVDIMHFSVGNAIPGRLYGSNPIDSKKGNGGDSFGHLVDLYAWNPHCRNLDGIKTGNDSGAQNDWKGAWWHSSLTLHTGFTEEDAPYGSSDQKGTYFFEFSRPLRTMDRFQQDVQFTIGQPSKFSAAFWYPVDGNPWHGSAHYSVGCDWVPLDMTPGSAQTKVASRNSSGVVSAFALILSVVSLCVSVFIGYAMTTNNNTVPFIPMDRL